MYTNVEDVKINSKNKNNLSFAKPTVNWIYNDKMWLATSWHVVPGTGWFAPERDRGTFSRNPSCRMHTCVTGTQGRPRLISPSACPPYVLSVKNFTHLQYVAVIAAHQTMGILFGFFHGGYRMIFPLDNKFRNYINEAGCNKLCHYRPWQVMIQQLSHGMYDITFFITEM